MHKDTAVLILHYRNQTETLACLDRVLECVSSSMFISLYVIDNSDSQNFSVPERDKNTALNVIKTGRNRGYAGGMNMGIRKALEDNARFLFLLNNDAMITAGCISALRDFLITEKKAGLVSPLILYKDSPEKIWATGSHLSLMTAKAVDRFHNKQKRALPQNPVMTDSVTGCSVMVRADVFKAVGLFDENYFAYYEDVDFCYRASLYGFSIYFFPGTEVYHGISGSTKHSAKELYLPCYYMIRNRFYFFQKYSRRQFLPVFLASVFLEFIGGIIKNICRKQLRKSGSFLMGIRDAVKKNRKPVNLANEGKISACIITKNAHQTIENCLKSLLGVVDEIVIVDTGSTDETVALCEQYTDRIFHETFNNDFALLRNISASYAVNPWILALDADEYLSEELRQTIRGLTRDRKYSGYYFKRCNFYGNIPIKYGYPGIDSLLKLYVKEGAFFAGTVHEKVITSGYNKKTHYVLYHKQAYNNYSRESFKNKWLKYVEIEAQEYIQTRSATFKERYLIAAPVNFLLVLCRDLFLLGGILDGLKGFKIAYYRAYYSFCLLLTIYKKLASR